MIDRQAAISILRTLLDAPLSKTQKEALKSVIDFVCSGAKDDIPDDPEERRALIQKIEHDLVKCMTEDEFRRMVALYGALNGNSDFNVIILPPGSDCMLRTDEEGGDYAGSNDL